MTIATGKSNGQKILIAGAGPAGTSLAIRLASAGRDVVLIEREKFPRQKLCGEFISPECLEHFRALGVTGEMLGAGGDRISNTVFFSPNGESADVPSDWFQKGSRGALSLSRSMMDLILLEKAKKAGVDVREEMTVRALLAEKGVVKALVCKDNNGVEHEMTADLYIDATGRARVLSKHAAKSAGVKPVAGRRKWVGFKAHFQNVQMDKGRCEIYFFRGGYGGLSFVEEGRANHCFLIRAEVVREFQGSAERVFNEVVLKNKRAAETLAGSQKMFDWISVAVDGFGTKEPTHARNLFSVGDSSAFIDPFTGSGMLMAFESSRILADCVERNNNNYEVISKIYTSEYQRFFSNRLRFCALLRRLSFSPAFATVMIKGLKHSKVVRHAFARATRVGESEIFS